MDNNEPTNTNPAVKAVPAQAANPAPVEPAKPEKSNKSLLIILTILLILSLAAVGIFAYLYFSNIQNPANDQAPTSEITITNEVEEESKDSMIPVSLVQAETLIRDKYGLDTLETVLIDGWPRYIKNLDQANKILFTIYQIWNEGMPSNVQNIAFNDFNDTYTYYFGDAEPLEKKDYQLDSVISEIVYRPEDDSFDIYFPDGVGGISFTKMLSKINDITDTKEGFKATVLTVTLDSNVRQNVEESLGKSGDGTNWFYEILMTDETLEEIRDSLSAYEFNFVSDAGEYKLASINKI